MENKILKIISVSILLILGGCDVMDSTKVKVYNHNNDTIFCIVVTENDFNSYSYSPLEQSKEFNGMDTILVKSNHVIFPNDSSLFSSYDWRYYINSSTTKQLNVFIFNYNTLKNKSWSEIKENTLYDKKISMTIDELNSTNWEIHLPHY